MPISKDGVVNPNYEIFSLFLILSEIVILCLINGIRKNKLLILTILLLYLSISTISIIDEHFKFSLPRFLYVAIPLLFFSLYIRVNLNYKFYLKVLDIIFLLVVLGNIISFFNLLNINEFIVGNYTQYFGPITNNQLLTRKPILIFGVHNLAAFFYMGLFLLTYFSFYYLKIKKYLYQSIIYLFLILLLRCSTSFMFLIYAMCVVLYLNRKSYKIFALFLLMFVVCILFINSEIFELYKDMLGSQANGIIPRYIEGFTSLYRGNYEVLMSNLLGIGFSVGDSSTGLYYADSGYILILTTGGVLYFVFFYLFFLKFVCSNLEKKAISFIIIGFVLLMEFGFISFFYYKTIAFMIFIIYFCKAICQNERLKDHVYENKIKIN